MTTLVDNELFDYLTHLEEEVGKRISTNSEGSLQHLMHSQMRMIIGAERNFIEYINSNGTQPVLSISPNGLPSVASLIPDLEKICELTEEETSFGEVAQRFRKGINGKNKGDEGHLYVPVTDVEWGKELASRSKEKLQSQIGFAVSETEEGKFEIAVREDIHLQGYDNHSKDFPVLIREGKMRYHVVWNKLLDNPEESFYVPNTALVLQGKLTNPIQMKFDHIIRKYEFFRRDYKSSKERIPFFYRYSWVPTNYSNFLISGTKSRVNIANNILDTLSQSLGRRIDFKGISREELETTLAFYTVPFSNSPKTTPYDSDLSELNTVFQLISTTGGEVVGSIKYFLPRKEIESYFDSYSGPCSFDTFNFGGVNLEVYGYAISNGDQFEKLNIGLKKIKTKR